MRAFKCKCGQDILVDDDNYDKMVAIMWHCSRTSLRASYWNKQTKKTSNLNIGEVALNVRCLPNCVIDHIDNNNHNNQRINLRPASKKENCTNRPVRSDSLSGLKGICYRYTRKAWSVHITANGQRLQLGTFKSKLDAIKVYNEAAKKYHGEFAVLNPET